MDFTQEQFDAFVHYTLRIELLNGKVLHYPVDAANKHYVSTRLRGNTDTWDGQLRPFPFLWFKTVNGRNVIVANDSIVQITICFDHRNPADKPVQYHDNFNLLGKEPVLEEWENDEGEPELHVFGNNPPQAFIYHKGNPPDDGYSGNPLTYNDLEENCLGAFSIELEGDAPLRRFISLLDNDGEESFIPTAQILVMEFDRMLMDPGEEEEKENEDWMD